MAAKRTQTAAAKARQTAKLKPFRKGTSGNPKGRPAASMSVLEWLNQMAEWDKAAIEKVLADDKSSNAKAAAARVWLHARSAAVSNGGLPIAGAEFDRIVDRMFGKPKQAVDHTSGGETFGIVFVDAKPPHAND